MKDILNHKESRAKEEHQEAGPLAIMKRNREGLFIAVLMLFLGGCQVPRPPQRPPERHVKLNVKQPQTRTFNNPLFKGLRLDWCLHGTQCGAPAANAYCKLQGYDFATEVDKAENIGEKSPTRVIHSNRICNKKTCDGFSQITCTKQNHLAVR